MPFAKQVTRPPQSFKSSTPYGVVLLKRTHKGQLAPNIKGSNEGIARLFQKLFFCCLVCLVSGVVNAAVLAGTYSCLFLSHPIPFYLTLFSFHLIVSSAFVLFCLRGPVAGISIVFFIAASSSGYAGSI